MVDRYNLPAQSLTRWWEALPRPRIGPLTREDDALRSLPRRWTTCGRCGGAYRKSPSSALAASEEVVLPISRM